MVNKTETLAGFQTLRGLNKYYFFFISLIILLVLLSAYILFSEVAAQIKAGIQPIIVICKIRQMIPDIILPCNSKESHGKKKANTYLIVICS
jgi:hypothetical protein